MINIQSTSDIKKKKTRVLYKQPWIIAKIIYRKLKASFIQRINISNFTTSNMNKKKLTYNLKRKTWKKKKKNVFDNFYKLKYRVELNLWL